MPIPETATELVAGVLAGRRSSRELLEEQLERISRHDTAIGAVVALDAEEARRRCDEADAAAARGERWGPLHGLPITVKDSFEVAGLPTTAGVAELADHRPTAHAAAVSRLVEAGAIVFGKTNLPAWAAGLQTFNDVFGTTGNPWDPTRTAGGSSGGAAAALAAGYTALELGSDIGGSIRNPAHFCGVYGHKASYDLVPLLGHIPGPPGSRALSDLAVAGPLARSAEDLDLALGVLAGPDPRDAPAWRVELPPPRADRLDGYRVAVWRDHPRCPVSAGVESVLTRAVDALADAGARVEEAGPPADPEAMHGLYLRLLHAAQAPGYPARIRTWADDAAGALPATDHSRVAEMLRGIAMRHRDWLAADERRHRLRDAWAAFFEDHDVLLCPVAPTTAYPHDRSDPSRRTLAVDDVEMDYWEQLAWVGPATLAHLPATVAPVGLADDGLPVGLQIVGPYLGDRTTIRFAAFLGEVVGGFRPPPLSD